MPETLRPRAPLVVVLHGCTQSACGYDHSAGWSKLADEQGFVVLFPEQQRANNPNLCFNWFSHEDCTRGSGEALSIRQMVAAAQIKHGTDPTRVFITGLSAGGAMAAVMLATYPDVFAGGAVIAGLPYGVAHSVPEAFDRMRGQGGPSAAELPQLVRSASGHSGNWPTLSVWHGTADSTVDRSNAVALLAQWLPLHGVERADAEEGSINGYPRRAWRDSNGRSVVEEYSITGMGHGTPLDPANSLGTEVAAPFMLDVGISSTRRIASFWGISDEQLRAAQPVRPAAKPKPSSAPDALAFSGIGKTIDDALRAAGLLR